MHCTYRTCLVGVFMLSASIAFAQATATLTHNANLRSTPSSTQAPIRMLAPNEIVTLVTTTPVNSYYHVRTSQNEDGWVYRTYVKMRGGAASPVPVAAAACGPGTEIVINASCPAVGMHSANHSLVAYAADSDPGLRNMAKRHLPDPNCAAKPFTLDDARGLQNYVDNTFADAHSTKTVFQPTRAGLQNIATFHGKISEGDRVSLNAYLVKARDEGAESVNCAGNDGTDIHISVGPKGAHPTEFEGIVAEMIPQVARPGGWNSVTLNRLAGKQVLLIGGLAYDNEHLVNDNPASVKAGQPKRFSLWEVHPITAFYVCPAGDGCNPSNFGEWVTLTEWAKSNP